MNITTCTGLPKFYLLILVIWLIMGCSHLSYYGQAVYGQWHMHSRMQSIELLVNKSTKPVALKQRLTDILNIRAFASQVLHLPDNRSYTYYADLERPYAVWSVFAAPAFSLKLKQWCFLVVGCVSYRGYFNQATAQSLANQLRDQGYDVYVAGIAAYSTLGWFDDPVLNTMLKWSKTRLAGLIFHELAHQQLYVKNDTVFNESFATTVEYLGVERWLAQYGTPEEMIHYQQSRQRQQEFIRLILTTRQQLQQLYQQKNRSLEQLRIAKMAIFDALRTQYRLLKQQHWQGYQGYDDWFAQDLNNAKLLSVTTYQDWVPAFQKLFAQLSGDFSQFYHHVAQLGQLPLEPRHAFLHHLMTTSQ